MNKKIFLAIITYLFFNIGHAQVVSINGDYISQKTSFQDVNNPDNSFVEEVINNIFIQIDDNCGVFAFQNMRFPNNILSYKINSFKGRIDDGENEIFTYNCTSLHSEEPSLEKIILYIFENRSINVKISDSTSNQIFYGLIKQ